VRILRRDSRAPPAATVVAVRVVRRMRRDGIVLRHSILVLARHYCVDGFVVVVVVVMWELSVRCVGGAEDVRKLANNKALS
jgi:hypothetical protein